MGRQSPSGSLHAVCALANVERRYYRRRSCFGTAPMSSASSRLLQSFPAPLLAALAFCTCGATAAGLAAAAAADASISPPTDTRYPGTIRSRGGRQRYRARDLPCARSAPGQLAAQLTLLYPMWIPGNHSPSGPIAMLAGLTITANGRRLQWTRDEYNVYAFHVDVPRDVSSLDVDFQYLSGRSGLERIQMTDRMLSLRMERCVPVSGRLLLTRHHVRAERDAASWLAVRHGAGYALPAPATPRPSSR